MKEFEVKNGDRVMSLCRQHAVATVKEATNDPHTEFVLGTLSMRYDKALNGRVVPSIWKLHVISVALE